ncbi:MAG TPA: nuclear transport factor 2 family protein [Anaerolineales bacterium]|nr:nuclear transport factor 2 family protein [Anaerolineales bacterium]
MSHYHQDTEQAIRAWLTELQACVRAVDYDRAQKIFAPDVVGFGTYASMAQGLEALRAEQWSNIWPTIREFTFRLDELHWGGEGDLAWAACPWDSIGFHAGGTAFARPGRVTVILERRDGAWLAVHTHFSLYPR